MAPLQHQAAICVFVIALCPLLFAGHAMAQQAKPNQAKPEPPPVLPKLVKNELGIQFVLVPAGEFLMGSPPSEKNRQDDENQHRVRIGRVFYLQTTEVTQKQWRLVMGTEPWKGQVFQKQGDDYPATFVSWDDANAFCRKLGGRDGVSYALPTESQWEYACRAGSRSSYGFGDDVSALKDFAWYDGNADKVVERYAHRVGQKKANAFGLFDMHGNVWEWCADWYGKEYDALSTALDPTGPDKGSERVYRGGSWLNYPLNCRSAYRDRRSPDFRRYHVGFRVLRNAPK